MRAPRILPIIGLGTLVTAGFVWFTLPELLHPQYFGLRHKSARYYIDLTAACDSLIAQHPLGTNNVIRIPVTDPSLPKLIQDLRPIKVQVSPRRVWLLLGSDSHAGFGLAWEPQYGQTNLWILHTSAESVDTVIYAAER